MTGVPWGAGLTADQAKALSEPMAIDFNASVNPQDRLLTELEARKRQMIGYCEMKLKQGDYHGVADAAMDIRELDAKLELLRDGK